jgi:two-component system chemotaxis response regulator CheB
MAKRNIIVMGGSTGSFSAVKTIAAGLPEDLEASIFIVWHMSPDVRSLLPDVLNRSGKVPASEARGGERIKPNHIYVAKPDHHLVIDGEMVRTTRGPKENRFRPALDPLFRSAAYSYRQRVIGVVLSGGLDDGTSGLWTVKHFGGVAVVQDPNEAEAPSMPDSAIHDVAVDHVVRVDQMADLLVRLSCETVEMSEVVMEDEKRIETEVSIAKEDNAFESGIMDLGELAPYTCPDCHGILTTLRDGKRPRFRCHTGHAFTADALLEALTENIEASMWNAVRGMEEGIMLLDHMGRHLSEEKRTDLALLYFQRAREARERAHMIRETLLQPNGLNDGEILGEAGEGPSKSAAESRAN